MSKRVNELLKKLSEEHRLEIKEYTEILENASQENIEYASILARQEREKHYGKEVYIRGLIEISNICKNDCYYCGIRKSNSNCDRYRLTKDEILSCCDEGYALGFRTFVMQGGEDGFFTDDVLSDIISSVKEKYPDCAVTLSLGERSKESYLKLKNAGADRYLLRHETIDENHYKMLHPENMSWQHRIDCLNALRECGYQVGCGFMVGSPYQDLGMFADELKFIESFKPEMCGIGPFIPHKDTKFSKYPHGSVSLTCLLLSCIRLIHPKVLLPSTTALASLEENGRERGILAGANVVMPNLSPQSVREKYMLYDNKKSSGTESAEEIRKLDERLKAIGYYISVSRGDAKE